MQNSKLNFSIDVEEENNTNTGCDLSLLNEYVEKYKKLEEEIQLQEEKLSKTKKEYRELTEKTIPLYLHQYNLSEIKLESGDKIKVKNDVSCSVSNYEKFENYLRSRDELDIMSNVVSLKNLNNEDRKKLNTYLQMMGFDYKLENKVHSQTLKAYVRNLLGTRMSQDELLRATNSNMIVEQSVLEKFLKIHPYSTTKIQK